MEIQRRILALFSIIVMQKESMGKVTSSSGITRLDHNSILVPLGSKGMEDDPADCSSEVFSKFRTIEGVSFLVMELADWQGVAPESVLSAVADSLRVKDQTHSRTLSYHPLSQRQPQKTLSLDDEDSEVEGEEEEIVESLRTGKTDRQDAKTRRLLNLMNIPRIQKASPDFELVTPDGLPRALLMLLSAHDDVLISKWVDLSPRTSLLDLLKMAQSDYGSNFDFRLKQLKSRGCLGLAFVGPLRGSRTRSLTIDVFTSTLQILWEDVCLPKVSSLLVYPGYVITIQPTRA